MSARVVLVLAALLLLGGGAAAFLVLKDPADANERGVVDRAEPPVRERPAEAGEAPRIPIRTADPAAPESRDEAAPAAPAGESRPEAGSLRPRSIDDLRLPPREQGLAGIVRDAKGIEIEGASLELHDDASPAHDGSEDGALRHKLVTNATGLFVFDKGFFASPDHFVLRIMHPEYSTSIRPIDATKPSPRNLFVTLHNGTGMSGTVRTVFGKPLTGATITVYDLKRTSEDPNGGLETTAATDGEGAFVVKSITSGPKRVVASLEGFATAALPDVTLEAAHPTVNLDFVLQKGSGILGRIWCQDGTAVQGALVIAKPIASLDAEGRKSGKVVESPSAPDPILRAASSTVGEVEEGADEKKDPNKPDPRPQLAPTARLQTALLTARTSAEGSFLIDGTEIGPYTISVSAPGFEKVPDQQVLSPNDGVVFTLVRIPSPDAPQPPRKK